MNEFALQDFGGEKLGLGGRTLLKRISICVLIAGLALAVSAIGRPSAGFAQSIFDAEFSDIYFGTCDPGQEPVAGTQTCNGLPSEENPRCVGSRGYDVSADGGIVVGSDDYPGQPYALGWLPNFDDGNGPHDVVDLHELLDHDIFSPEAAAIHS